MPNPRLATRYAKSLLDLAVEKEQLENIFTDMQWLQAVCKSSRDFVNLLRSPVIKADKKEKIVEAVTKGKVSELTAAFIRLLIRKTRENNLPEIITAFITQYRKVKNIYSVKLTTAAAISENLKNDIIEHIRINSDMKNVELETVVDGDIIGGFVLQAGDKLIDGSIAYDLKTISRQFENNDFIYKVR
ncbi:MAG TPA: ATP synthase F1 subunit delta [Chitinophagaceae bacterium]|nr:ATP synthase F1 subunit delta [Chitinophagaceae bacterium]